IINNKAKSKSNGCTYCSGREANHTNSLAALNPELTEHWDYKRNLITPHDITIGSVKKVWWVCSDCKSSYEATVNNRNNGTGCTYCSGLKVNHTNSLFILRPDLAEEWDYEKNTFTPHDVTTGTDKK